MCIYILSLGVWDPKLTNPKLVDRLYLWPVLPPVNIWCLSVKLTDITFEITCNMSFEDFS